jgi:hypothetical protein
VFDVGPLALVARSDHGLGHLVLDVGTLPDLGVLLDLLAAQRDVGDLATQPAALLAALRVEAEEDLVLLLRLVHDGREGAERALLEAVEASLNNSV